MLSRLSFVFLLMGTLLSSGSAAEWYCSSTATGSGNGSLASPWTLATALKSTSIKPGDTLWVRGGTYTGSFSASLNGNASLAVTVRNYNRERAVVDGVLDLGLSTYLTIWGLEIMDSLKGTRPDPSGTVLASGAGVRFINNIVHDCTIGFGPPGGTEAYGNVMWNCGKTSREHAIYWQNDGAGTKVIEDNLIGYSSGFGIHIYGSAGQLKNFNIKGNAVWGSGAVLDPKAEILLGGSQPVINGVVTDNHLYSYLGRGLQLGYGTRDTNATVERNYILGEMSVWLSTPFESLTFRNNKVVTTYHSCIFTTMSSVTGSPTLWNANSYYSTYSAWQTQFAFIGNSFLGFSPWKTTTGLDSTSTYANTAPPSQVVVRPNKYESKRGHVIVWNWSGAAGVDADLSTVLSVGDTYEIRTAYNFLAAPVATGTYSGGTVRMPMAGFTIAPNLYWTPYRPSPDFSDVFGCFVVIGTGSGANTAPTISSVSDVTLTAGVASSALAFTVGDGQTATTSLAVTASSSNTALVPNGNIVLGGAGSSRTVTVTPAAGQVGTATISLTVSDGSLTSSTSFVVSVVAVNTAPTISTSPTSASVTYGSSVNLAVTVGDAETSASGLNLTAASSNSTLLPPANIVLGGTGTSRSVSLTPAVNQSGSVVLTLTVTDGSLSRSQNIAITVVAGNTSPTISAIAATSTSINTPSAPISFTVGDTETSAGSLVVTAASSNTSLVPLSGLALGGTGASRTVTITPAANQIGTSTITVTVSDGSLTASSQFLLTVNSANASRFAMNLEAELSEITGPVTVVASAATSHGNYTVGQTADSGTMSFTFSVPAAGNYWIWSRILSANSASDSYYVSIDGQGEDIFDTAEGKWSPSWQWSAINGRSTSPAVGTTPRIFSLSAGAHTLTIRVREIGAGLDQILITDDQAYVPANAPIPTGVGVAPVVTGTSP